MNTLDLARHSLLPEAFVIRAICEALHRRGAKIVVCGSTDESVATARVAADAAMLGPCVLKTDARNEVDLRKLVRAAQGMDAAVPLLLVAPAKARMETL